VAIRNEGLLLQLRDAQRVGAVVPRLERMAERCWRVGDFSQASQLEEVIIRVREGHDIQFKARVYRAWMETQKGAAARPPEIAPAFRTLTLTAAEVGKRQPPS
jgi:hypothetical protein